MSRIRELNDQFRTTFIGGKVMLTQGVAALPLHIQAAIQTKVRTFTQFDDDSDPHHEHDFGAFKVGDTKFFWKIDTYDKALEYGSPDPSDPTVTARVLTIMKSSEY